jgi:ferrous iron transport protein B
MAIKKNSRFCANLPKKVIAVAGNPNVGKSTLFNHLTHMHQHTGNWPGKTVGLACGFCQTQAYAYQFVDIPGTYSLIPHSSEEAIACDFICQQHPDAVLIVCDATCLERNLNLALQIMEITRKVILCVNLLDEAKRKGIDVDLDLLSKFLGVPVVGIIARKPSTLQKLLEKLDAFPFDQEKQAFSISYPTNVQKAAEFLLPACKEIPNLPVPPLWLALRILEGGSHAHGYGLESEQLLNPNMRSAIQKAQHFLQQNHISISMFRDQISASIVQQAEQIHQQVVSYGKGEPTARDRKLDQIFTSKWTGYPIMLLFLALIFWITIVGANYPSQWLAVGLFGAEPYLYSFIAACGAAPWFCDLLISGVYHVVAWVISIMLPPMAIFFPLFTLLEDFGYLPRVAYNLDRPFQCCHACGKQALTMCAGLGCNAVGVTGCRIIDSPRERLIAILTNNFMPCNGRFPTMVALITLFFVTTSHSSVLRSLLPALGLAFLIILGVFFTFLSSKFLSHTILKGTPSSFALELPPYRRPEIGKVILRSLVDRTIFVLGRAICAAAPAGLVIWFLVHTKIGDATLLSIFSEFLRPFAQQLGLDGVLLMAFLLGLPANEIVLPIALMAYLSQSNLTAIGNFTQLHSILIANHWTWITAGSVLLFSLLHWPCATTLLTIRKESGSWKWTGVAFLLPTAIGMVVCFLFSHVAAFFL